MKPILEGSKLCCKVMVNLRMSLIPVHSLFGLVIYNDPCSVTYEFWGKRENSHFSGIQKTEATAHCIESIVKGDLLGKFQKVSVRKKPERTSSKRKRLINQPSKD